MAATFREERIGSVLEPLMTFLTGLTVVSIETTSVAPEEIRRWWGSFALVLGENITKHYI